REEPLGRRVRAQLQVERGDLQLRAVQPVRGLGQRLQLPGQGVERAVRGLVRADRMQHGQPGVASGALVQPPRDGRLAGADYADERVATGCLHGNAVPIPNSRSAVRTTRARNGYSW